VDNFNTLPIGISRRSPVVLTWPASSHPVGITDNKETLQEIAGLTVDYNEPDGPTTFTLASSFDGPLYYFCKNHTSMGVHEIFIKAGSCVPCAIDTFNSISGAPSCEACPATTSSFAQSDAITDCVCNAGFTGPDGQVCSVCVKNTFKHEKGDAACSFCPLNAISEEQSIAELDCICDLGYFQQTLDSLVCTACDAGKYKNIAGPDNCTLCGPDSNSLQASVDISDCLCDQGHGRLDDVCAQSARLPHTVL